MCTNASRNIQQQRTLFGRESSIHCKRIFEKVKTGVAIHLVCSKCGVRVRSRSRSVNNDPRVFSLSRARLQGSISCSAGAVPVIEVYMRDP